MKAVWVTRSFLDYRIPVYESVSRRFGGRFVLFFNRDYVPARCCRKAENVLGHRARGLGGERALRFGPQAGFANEGLRVPYQPGLIRAVLREKPDVLITDGFFQWTYAALWLRATRGIPHVMCYEKTAHTERHAQWFRTAFRRKATRWVDAMCCNGRLCGEYVQGLGFPPVRITYGHMVADVENLARESSAVTDTRRAQLALAMRLSGVTFLYVGRLIPRKGLRELLVAWRMFVSRVAEYSAATLLLVGDGEERPQLEQYCAKHGLSNVRFAGAVNYDRLPAFYRCADILVMPTLEDNWSLVVPEAMACGLPVLCSKHNGCWPELVTDGNGWVFEPLVPSDTLRVLMAALDAGERLLRMGQCSRDIVDSYTAVRAAEAIYEASMIALGRQARRSAG